MMKQYFIVFSMFVIGLLNIVPVAVAQEIEGDVAQEEVLVVVSEPFIMPTRSEIEQMSEEEKIALYNKFIALSFEERGEVQEQLAKLPEGDVQAILNEFKRTQEVVQVVATGAEADGVPMADTAQQDPVPATPYNMPWMDELLLVSVVAGAGALLLILINTMKGKNFASSSIQPPTPS